MNYHIDDNLWMRIFSSETAMDEAASRFTEKATKLYRNREMIYAGTPDKMPQFSKIDFVRGILYANKEKYIILYKELDKDNVQAFKISTTIELRPELITTLVQGVIKVAKIPLVIDGKTDSELELDIHSYDDKRLHTQLSKLEEKTIKITIETV